MGSSNKKFFFIVLALIFSIFALGRVLKVYYKPKKRSLSCEVRGTWVTGSLVKNEKSIEQILKKITGAHMNTIFLKVPAITNNKDLTLKKYFISFIKKAKKYNLSIHAWIANRYRTIGKKADFTSLQEQRKQALWAFELLQKYRLDGIHLDYIRYDKGEISPQKKFPRVNDKKTKGVTQTVSLIYKKIKKKFPDKYLSAAVWTISLQGKLSGGPHPGWKKNIPFHRQFQQDPIFWLKSSIIDAVIPMVYTKEDSYWIFEVEQWKKALAKKIGRVYMGLGWLTERGKLDWGHDIEGVIRKIKYGRKKGIKGFVLFRFYDLLDIDQDGKDDDWDLIKALTEDSLVNHYNAPFKDNVKSCFDS